MTVLCVWLGFKVNAARRQKEAVEAILKTGGEIAYSYQADVDVDGLIKIDRHAAAALANLAPKLVGGRFPV